MDDLLCDVAAPILPFTIPDGINSDCHFDREAGAFIINVPDGELIFAEHFFNQKISDRSVEYFQENDTLDWRNIDWTGFSEDKFQQIHFANIRWKRDKIKMYGKQIPLPRLTSWYGDQGRSYSYSGINSQPNMWNKGLLYLKNAIEKVAGVTFNSVLLNWYRNGEDYLNWHADDEPKLGDSPVIASVNFGATRDFVIRRNDDNAIKITIPLKHGTLLIMKRSLQHFWQHQVPKRKKVKGSRFNLTFRNIKT